MDPLIQTAGRTRQHTHPLVLLLPGLFLCAAAPVGAVPGSPVRVVTLSPALAAMVFEIGAGSELVGTVRYSRDPPAARRVPRVGDAFGLDLSRIVLLDPTWILAWKGGTPAADLASFKRLHLRVVTLGTGHVRGIAHELVTMGQLLGRIRQARRVADRFRAAVRSLRERHRGRMRVRVFYEIGRHPLYTVGRDQIISRAIALCGGVNLFSDVPHLAFPVSLASVLTRDPGLIVVGHPRSVAFWKHFPEIAAVRDHAVDRIPPSLLAQASPRMLRGLRMLCRDISRARCPLSPPGASSAACGARVPPGRPPRGGGRVRARTGGPRGG